MRIKPLLRVANELEGCAFAKFIFPPTKRNRERAKSRGNLIDKAAKLSLAQARHGSKPTLKLN